MKTLEEYRAAVVAKLTPEAPSRPKAEDVLAAARAKCTDNVIRFNAASYAQSRALHQQHSMCRVQFGDYSCAVDDNGDAYSSDAGGDGGGAAPATTAHSNLICDVGAPRRAAASAAQDTTLLDSATVSVSDASRASWRTASALLGASRRRKSMPDMAEYSQAAAAAAAASVNAMLVRSGEGGSPRSDLGCETWVHRAATLTTNGAARGKRGKLNKSRLLHLLHNNAGPAAVVAVASGAVPADLGVDREFEEDTDDEDGNDWQSPYSRNGILSTAPCISSPRPPMCQRRNAQRRSSTCSSSAFMSGPQAFGTEMSSVQEASGSWILGGRNGSTGGGVEGIAAPPAVAADASCGDDTGEWPACTSPSAASCLRYPAGSLLCPAVAGVGRSLSRCSSTLALAGSPAASLRALRVTLPPTPDANSTVVSPASPRSQQATGVSSGGTGTGTPFSSAMSPPTLGGGRHVRRSVSCASYVTGAARVSASACQGSPFLQQQYQHQELPGCADFLEEQLLPGEVTPRRAEADAARSASATLPDAITKVGSRSVRAAGNLGSTSMKARYRGADIGCSGLAARSGTGRPMTAAEGQVPTANAGGRRSIDEALLSSFRRSGMVAEALSAPQVHMASPASALQTGSSPQSPKAASPLGPTPSRRQSRVAPAGPCPDAAFMLPAEKPRLGRGTLPAVAVAAAASPACRVSGGGATAASPTSPASPNSPTAGAAPGALRNARLAVLEAGASRSGGGGKDKEEPGLMARLFRELKDLRKRAEGDF